MTSTVHSFIDELAFSHAQETLPMWEEMYKQAFPTFATMMSVRKDGWAQRGGVDRVVLLGSGKHLWVDEKCRRKNYGDICLEYFSDAGKRTPGWMEKDLACDYIAYAILPIGVGYLLPFQQLRAAWKEYRHAWVEQYRKIRSLNKGYVTLSVGVPPDVLLGAVQEAMCVQFSPITSPTSKQEGWMCEQCGKETTVDLWGLCAFCAH